jgi:hypothetical protein
VPVQDWAGADFGLRGSAWRWVIFQWSFSVRKIMVARRTCGTGAGWVMWWTVQRSMATVYAASAPTYLSRYSNSTGCPVSWNCDAAHSYLLAAETAEDRALLAVRDQWQPQRRIAVHERAVGLLEAAQERFEVFTRHAPSLAPDGGHLLPA